MDKMKKYQKILKEVLTYYALKPYSKNSKMESHLIINEEKTQFLFFRIGWEGKKFCHSLYFHFQIKNKKVWLLKNNTDIEIGKKLVEKGIPKSDIVIGFVSEFERTTEGYALAYIIYPSTTTSSYFDSPSLKHLAAQNGLHQEWSLK